MFCQYAALLLIFNGFIISATTEVQHINLTDELLLTFKNSKDSLLQGHLGLSPESATKILNKCQKVITTEEGLFCVDIQGKFAVSVTKRKATVECYNVIWSEDYEARDCINLGDRHWYGGGEVEVQRWPLLNENRQKTAYITGDFFHYQYGGVIESLWISSDGFAIYADPTLDLEVSLNATSDGKLCLNVLRLPQLKKRPLQYTLCSSHNIKETAHHLFREVWMKPKMIPDKLMMTEPIWSTWAYYKANINQTLVLDYAKQILNSSIGASHIEIDDKWEDCYGNLQFDAKKFPNPSAMVEQLKSDGFRSTFWVHPFVNKDCKAFVEGSDKGYFVRNGTSDGPPQLVTWWNGVGAYIDTTNPSTTQWYIKRLAGLMKQHGFHGYKFDAGEVFWMPSNSILFDCDTSVNKFTTNYVDTASKLGELVEVRSAHNNQDLGVYVRMLDKNSLWGYTDGLKTLIPTTLLFSVSGYPFVLPDMIGGNNAEAKDGLPERELYLKWLLATALLPVMQFSIPPWAYDDEVVQISRDMVKLHRDNAHLFISLAENAVRTGEPIIRPLWWLAPEDPVTYVIDSEFLVGEEILVAPILEKGADSRDIYIPSGKWRDELRGSEVVGPVWLREYRASLKELPRFRAL